MWRDRLFHLLTEVAPPGWGHTVAKKEKTKPNKPKSKIGGTANAMKKAKAEGRMPGVKNIFALMWSMKNKGDKPHYKPGVKGKKKKKYKNEAKKATRADLDKVDKIFRGVPSYNPSKAKTTDEVDFVPTPKSKPAPDPRDNPDYFKNMASKPKKK